MKRPIHSIAEVMVHSECRWCGSNECDCEERINCDKAGSIGHLCCGWCHDHDGPMFQCYCGTKFLAETSDD